MCSDQVMFPGQLPPNGDYHTLLHTQIYDYFLSMGMFKCGQSLLESDGNLRHKVMSGPRQDTATVPPPSSPPLPVSGPGSSYSSPGMRACPTAPENMSRPCEEPALLYQWFCTFWDMFESCQNGITGSAEGPMQDFATLPLNISDDCFQPQPISWQDPINLQPYQDVCNPSPSSSYCYPYDTTILTSCSPTWRPTSPQSDITSTSSKRSDSNLRLLSFQNCLGGLIKNNDKIVHSLKSQIKQKGISSRG